MELRQRRAQHPFSNLVRILFPTYLYRASRPCGPPLTIIREPITASHSPRSNGATISGQTLGRVLAVAVEQDDDVEVVLDRQSISGLLVAAVAEVVRVTDDRQRKVVRQLLVAEPTRYVESSLASSHTNT